jgi:hypothetical protein
MQRQHIFSIPSTDHQRDRECAPDVLAHVLPLSKPDTERYQLR